MHQQHRLAWLLQRFTEGHCTVDEKTELMHLIRQEEHHAGLQQLIQDIIERSGTDREMDQIRSEEIFKHILLAAGRPKTAPVKRFNWKTWAAAASLLLTAGAITFLLMNRTEKNIAATQSVQQSSEETITPAGNRAILTLADGSSILLDSAGNGALAQLGNIIVEKTKDGQLIYKVSGVDKNGSAIGGPTSFNTISTPKGGQYQIILPDGTQVWLNAASTLTFPTVFNGTNRNVELSGEAYFEVAQNKNKPFTVGVNGSVITVLGTHFNVNGYSDEQELNTTLLEGSIKFAHHQQEKTLVPGQQVIYTSTAQSMVVREADIKQVMGWKNGFFEFDNMDLQSIMRQIARWYDVDIQYQGNSNDIRLSGGISRKLNLQDLQKLMESNGIHFTIEGRKLIVSS